MKTYIGDSIYAEIKDGVLVLTTENGFGPSNTIIMESAEYVAFVTREAAKNG